MVVDHLWLYMLKKMKHVVYVDTGLVVEQLVVVLTISENWRNVLLNVVCLY